MDESRHSLSYKTTAFQKALLNLTEGEWSECISCHGTLVGNETVESVTCVACHSDPKTVDISDPVTVCRKCHSKISGKVAEKMGETTKRMNNEFERWSFAKHSNATGRLFASVEYRALETNEQRLMCLSCHSTDFEVVDGEIRVNDGDIGCVTCHGGVNPREEIKSVEKGKFKNYADARQYRIKNIDHRYAVPSSYDFCGNCHSGYHHPQASVWKTGEHAGIKCVTCHGETISSTTHELDMDHTFMVNYKSCGKCHDATTRIDKWDSLQHLENEAFRIYHEADGKLEMALSLGVSKIYVGEAQRKLEKAQEQLGVARNAYFHNQKQMREALSNATILSKEADSIIDTSVQEFKTTMKTIGVVTTIVWVVFAAVIFLLIYLWHIDYRLLKPVKKFIYNLRNIKSLPPTKKRRYIISLSAVIFIFLAFNGGFAWYSSQPSFCKTCHVMTPMYESWNEGPHSGINCHTCHIETKLDSALKGLNYGSAIVYGRYAATGIPEVPKEICKECHDPKKIKPERLIHQDEHAIHPSYFNCNTCHKTHLVVVSEEMCSTCHVPGYTRVVKEEKL